MKKILLVFWLLLMAAMVSAQDAEPKSVLQPMQESSYERLLDGFARMYANGLQEKVYIMTDKPYYSAGEIGRAHV